MASHLAGHDGLSVGSFSMVQEEKISNVWCTHGVTWGLYTVYVYIYIIIIYIYMYLCVFITVELYIS